MNIRRLSLSLSSLSLSPLKVPSAAAALALASLLTGAPGVAAEAPEKSGPSQAELERKLDAAQERLEAAAREVADLSMSLSDHFVPHSRGLTVLRKQRALLGIAIGREEADDGVPVMSVSPGGGAEKAGLKAGDVLLEIDGKALKRDGETSSREKLFAAMRGVEPGDKVAVRYRRDGKVSTASVLAEEPEDRFFARGMPLHGRGHRMPHMPPMPGMPHIAFMRADNVFGSAELVSLTPGLGQYFGTDKGLLVVRAPADSRLKLQDGDVIVDIDGRTPSSPSHAFRILGSYQPGEKLKLNILRAKKRMTFDLTIPEDAGDGPLGHFERSRFFEHAVPALPTVQAIPAMAPAPPLAMPAGALVLELTV